MIIGQHLLDQNTVVVFVFSFGVKYDLDKFWDSPNFYIVQ